ncbi:MAG: WYL domain-containing protein, partial [Actinobacteria bacterium]|nr:WYL domain-containing protein [Actinomycetota bacterium]
GGWALRKLRLGGPGGEQEAGSLTLLADLDEHPHLPTLHSAIRRRATVTFSHSGATRTVEPARLLFRDGHWYLQGFDRLRQAVRNFRVDRIQGEVEVGAAGTSAPPAPSAEGAPAMPREPWLIGAEQPETATLRVDSVLASKALADVGPSGSVERHDDGSVTITLPVVQRAAFRSWVLGFLDHAVVLSPPDLRSELVDWLAAVADAGHS